MVKAVCVVSGILDSDFTAPELDGAAGRAWTPRAWAAGWCVRKARGAVWLDFSLSSAVDVDVRGGCFGGDSSARSRAICASLRFFSASSAVCSFSVSTSFRRSAYSASGVS